MNSPPAVAGDRAFVTTFVEVFCLATDRDEVLWRGPETKGIQGAPTVTDDTLFVNGGGYTETPPRLTAFDFDGTERWSYESGVRSRATPAVGDGAVFVTSDAGVHAVELETGEERFVSDAVSHGWGSVAVADGTAYVVDYRSSDERRYRLYALDTADGSVRWAAETGPARGPPVVADGTVYAVGPNETMLALDAEDGSARELPNRRAVPVACTGDVLYVTNGGTLYAYDATTGEGLWSYATPEVQVSDTVNQTIHGVTPVDGAVYVDAADGLHGVGPAE
ncbi:PQQ-like domain-containing protein [Halogeometricum limi]|uniref:PQQ-like domain-containing protein n=1 Tax=Halogeometricum limi TaxID=555875 RepID=A0A1I6FS53_9EURY|nr:PQQ-like domain-containing protein [Halogeometricum limi]